ncbi:MAG: hypothetical protein UCO70_09150, partial [Collinsella stercoris]|nr:hypothetical protein [Collinsella stercoris]
LDVPLEVAVRRVHVLPSSLSSCDACTRFAARVPSVHVQLWQSLRARPPRHRAGRYNYPAHPAEW